MLHLQCVVGHDLGHASRCTRHVVIPRPSHQLCFGNCPGLGLVGLSSLPGQVKQSERPRVPDDIIRLRTMTSVAVDFWSEGADAGATVEPCFACGRGGLADAVDTSGPLARCSLCLLTMHSRCGQQLESSVSDFRAPRFTLPAVFVQSSSGHSERRVGDCCCLPG